MYGVAFYQKLIKVSQSLKWAHSEQIFICPQIIIIILVCIFSKKGANYAGLKVQLRELGLALAENS